MIYTYELSVQVKKFLKGEVEAFEKIFVMTADDVYFHVSMVISDPEEAERMVIKIYKDMYMQFGRLDKVENVISWYNEIIYHELDNWIGKNYMELLVTETKGKFDHPVSNNDVLYGEKLYNESETALIAIDYIYELNPIHQLTSLAYFFDKLAVNEIANLLQVDDDRINKRVKYITLTIEDYCKQYAKTHEVRIANVDAHMILLAYVQLFKSVELPHPNKVYKKIIEALQ
jgi:DNA-directed RNA polymerase specialized sigma24 family protein